VIDDAGQSIEVPVLIDRGGQNVVEIAADQCRAKSLAEQPRHEVTEGIRDHCACCCFVSFIPANAPGEISQADASVDLVHFTIPAACKQTDPIMSFRLPSDPRTRGNSTSSIR
jgi:hypothetical protein